MVPTSFALISPLAAQHYTQLVVGVEQLRCHLCEMLLFAGSQQLLRCLRFPPNFAGQERRRILLLKRLLLLNRVADFYWIYAAPCAVL